MRHEKSQPGCPTPVDTLNAARLKKALAGTAADRARSQQNAHSVQVPELHAVVIADMVALLDEGRILRGYADIYDLMRAGYSADLAADLGPYAARALARQVAEVADTEPVAALDRALGMEAA